MLENPRIYPFSRNEAEQLNMPPFSTVKNDSKAKAVPWEIIIMVLTGFLFARAEILGGLYPFGPAFLGAVAVIYRRQIMIFVIPLILGAYTVLSGEQLYVYAAIFILLAVIFSLYNVDSKKQWFVVPSMVFAAVLVSKGLVLTLGTYNSYLLLISVFESIFAAGLSLVFMVVLTAVHRFDISRRFSLDETICLFVVLLSVICGLSGWQVGGIAIQDIFSRFLIILVAYLGGAGAGAASGAMVGIIPSISAIIAPSSIATYSFSGLLSGVFSSFGRLGSVLGFLLGNLILALYLINSGEISTSLGASVVAAIIFFILPQKGYKKLKSAFGVAGLKSAKEEKSERLLGISLRRLKNAGWIFNDLSNSFSELLQEEEEKEEDKMKIIINHLSGQLCSQCSMKEICWKMDYSHTYRGVIQLFSAVEEKGKATIYDVPENFKKRCPHLKELLAIINCLYEMYCRSNYWQLQRQNSRRLLSKQLSGVSEILKSITKDITEYSTERELLEREFSVSLAKRGYAIESAGVASLNDKFLDVWIQFSVCPGEILCRQGVEEELSRLLGHNYKVHEIFCDGGNCNQRCRYRLLKKGALSLNVGKAQLSKDEKGICGDSGDSLLLEEGKQLLMISDGMGSGQKAALESGAAISLVSRLLEAGFGQETAIDTVNAALSLRGKEESFVTLDLCIIDLYGGDAEFIKTGAAPSFIKRGSAVKTIKGSSLPVGILFSADKEVFEEKIIAGDMIILASDGLLDADKHNDSQWLNKIIQQAPSSDAQGLAEYLLEKAVNISGGRLKDDITILVAEVNSAA